MDVHDMMDRVNNIGQRIIALNANELVAARNRDIDRMNRIYAIKVKLESRIRFLLRNYEQV